MDVGLLFSSDGSFDDLGFVVLDDDRNLQNVDNVTPAVLSTIAVPSVVDALNGLSAVLTTEVLAQLNKKVDIDRVTAADVAAARPAEKGLG